MRATHRAFSSLLALALLAMVALVPTHSQAAPTDTFRASLNKNAIFLGETVTLKIEINIGKRWYSNLRLPRFRRTRIKKRAKKKLREALFVGGKSQIRYIWRISHVLQPRKAGVFRSSPGKLWVGRQKYTIPPMTITVRKGKPIPRAATGQLPAYIKARGDVFLLPILTPKQVYVDQQATISWYLFRRIDAHLDRPQIPRLADFWKEPLVPIHPLANWRIRHLQGKQYSYTLALRYAIFPMRAGQLKVDGLSFRSQRSYAARRGLGSLIQSPALSLKVLPVPKSATNDKVVGRYKIKARFTQRRFRTKEPIALEVAISGVGNIRQLAAPTISFPSRTKIRVVSERASTDIKKTNNQIQGTKRFTYILHAATPGHFKVPALPFSSFDPWQRQHQSQRTSSLPFHVLAGSKHLLAVLKQRTPRNAPPARRVMALPKLEAPGAGKKDPERSILLLVLALPLLAFGSWFVLRKKAPALEDDENDADTTDPEAYQSAVQALQAWLQRHPQQPDAAALGQLDAALTALLQAWLTTPTAGLSRTQLLQELLQHQAPPTFVQALQALLQASDQARFSPIPTQHNIPASLQQVLQHLPAPR